MKCRYLISFEFETAQPVTYKGEAEAGAVHTVSARAMRDATKKLGGVRGWSSVVMVLERIEAPIRVEKPPAMESASDAI